MNVGQQCSWRLCVIKRMHAQVRTERSGLADALEAVQKELKGYKDDVGQGLESERAKAAALQSRTRAQVATLPLFPRVLAVLQTLFAKSAVQTQSKRLQRLMHAHFLLQAFFGGTWTYSSCAHSLCLFCRKVCNNNNVPLWASINCEC